MLTTLPSRPGGRITGNNIRFSAKPKQPLVQPAFRQRQKQYTQSSSIGIGRKILLFLAGLVGGFSANTIKGLPQGDQGTVLAATSADYATYISRLAKQSPVSNLSPEARETFRLMGEAMREDGGFVMGDAHDSGYIDTLRKALHYLKSQGLGVVYFEMLKSSEQEMVDRGLASGNLDEISASIARRWFEDDGGPSVNHESYLKMIDEATRLGIRVLGIDDGNGGADPNRLKLSNPHMMSIIQLDQQKSGHQPYVVFVGHWHTGMQREQGVGEVITGLDLLLGVKSFDYRGPQALREINPKTVKNELREGDMPSGDYLVRHHSEGADAP